MVFHRNVHHNPATHNSSGLKLSHPNQNTDDPLPSPSKSHSQSSSMLFPSWLKTLFKAASVPLLLIFSILLLLNIFQSSKKLQIFKIDDTAQLKELKSSGALANTNKKYEEILTRNWLLHQFKSLRNHFFLSVQRHKDSATDQQQITVSYPPNIFMNLSKAYDPLEFSRNEGINLWDLFPPNMNCPDLTRIGKVGEGGKWICGLSYLQSLEEDQCVIYSFGINDDISFEIELLLRTNCRIFAFDPTIGKLPIHSHQPNSSLDYVLQNNRRISVAEIRRRIVFQKIALSDFTGTSDQFMWNEALYDIMTRYHHNFINLLKVDIESSEWKIFRSLLYPAQPSAARSRPSLPVGELLIELHHESLEETVDFFQGLYEHHFFSVSREINLIPCLVGGKPFAAEYTFLNVNNFYGVRPTSQSATSSPLLLSSTTAQLRKEIVPVENLQGTAGVIYFLTRQSRVPRMCTALRLLRENFIEQFPRYPVLVFHDDLLSADEDYLRSKCFQLPRVKLLFVRIELKVPKQLTRRKVFIPKKTFCDPLVSSIGYRHMCRFHSHGVHKFIRELQPKLFPDLPRTSSDFFVWRLDDDSLLTAPIGYDIFQFMRMNKKLYGFVSLIKDDPKCVMGLWETSRKYFQRVSAHSFNFSSSLLSQWPDPIVFYNNFEVSHFSLWTHPLWEAFRDYLEQTGGIYTLRWGDAPIHTIGVSALLSRGQIHKFSDVGYSHLPFLQQKPRGLPMPGMDPFLLIPLECYYFKEWKCLVHYENNITANYSFSSAFQRDQFILSASMVQAGGSSSSPASSAVSLPSTVEQKGVLFSFGEERREKLLVRTIQSFFFNFAGPFRVPFVVFYDRRSSFNETVVRQGLAGLPELQLAFHPVQLPNVTHSTGEFVRKNGRCWIRSDPRELAVSLFLQRQVFEVLQLLGFSWFFRFPDDSRLLSPINSNPFTALQRSGKKFGFFSVAVVQSDCFQSLLGLTDDLCGHLLALRKAVGDSSLPDLAVPLLPTCSAGYQDWDKRRVMITSLSISHSSLWDSIFAAMLFDLTHQAGSSPLLSEEFLPSGSTSTAGSSQFHSLLSFFVQVKSSRDWREKIANWGDLFVHNAIVFLSLASEEIHRFDDVFLEFRFNADDSPAIGAETQKPAALAVPDRSANLLRRPLPSLELLLAAQPLGWLGADVAASVPFPNLENGQVKPPDKLLWLFGDTLLGLSSADKRVKEYSRMIDNSVALTSLRPEEPLSCGDGQAALVRPVTQHSFHFQRFNATGPGSGGGIFQLPEQSPQLCAPSRKLSIWPIDGVFLVDAAGQSRLVVLADVSCGPAASPAGQEQRRSEPLNTQTLDFEAQSQLLFLVENPTDGPEAWRYRVAPLSFLRRARSPEQVQFSWIALSEQSGRYFAGADGRLLVFSSMRRGDAVSYVLFRLAAKDLLELRWSQLELLVQSRSSGPARWQPLDEFFSAKDSPVPRGLFPPGPQPPFSFSHAMAMTEASFVKDTRSGRWTLVYYSSLQGYQFLLCSLDDEALLVADKFFSCEFSAAVGSEWQHPAVISYAGRLHPFLLPAARNHFQSTDITPPANCQSPSLSQSMVLSFVPNTVRSLDALFQEPDRHLPHRGKDIYSPKFVHIERIER